ncbi:hypothetical protein BX666DRAFT_1905254 [Dichotomocladium elegans]|nr:hypothetical protein BX666DRAFT_1905254 [Dichotomocladium elegans]
MAPASFLSKDSDLYSILSLDRSTATKADIRSQYRKLALKFHPDKQPATASVSEKEAATLKFQQLGFAYSILSDPAKKSRYDTTGNVDMEDSALPEDTTWNDYFKELWTGVVNAETIDDFSNKYRYSDEESRDVLKVYEQCKGDMNEMLNHIEVSEVTDGERFAIICQKAIDAGEIKEYRKFKETTTAKAHEARRKNHEKELKAWEKRHGKKQKKKEGGGKEDEEEPSLLALIQARRKDRASQLDNLADAIAARAAAAEGSNSKKRKRQNIPEDEGPSEEEFQRIQAKLMQNKKQR